MAGATPVQNSPCCLFQDQDTQGRSHSGRPHFTEDHEHHHLALLTQKLSFFLLSGRNILATASTFRFRFVRNFAAKTWFAFVSFFGSINFSLSFVDKDC